MKKQGFLYGSGILMIAMLIAKILGALFKLPLANLLRESGMGYFNTAYTLYTVIYALTVTGLSTAVSKLTAEFVVQRRYLDVRRLRRVALFGFSLIGLAGMGIIMLSANQFSNFMKSSNSYWSILGIAPSVLFCAQMAAYRGYYEGLSDMRPTAVSQALEAIMRVVVGLSLSAIVFWWAEKQSMVQQNVIPFASAAALIGVSLSTMFGLAYLVLRDRLKGDGITKLQQSCSPSPEPSASLFWKLLKMAFPITMGAVVLQVSSMIDVVTIQTKLAELPMGALTSKYGGYLMEGEKLHEFLYGCFTSVVILFNLVPSFTNIFGKSGLPGITAAWTRKERAEIKRELEKVIQVTTLVAAPMAFGLSFLAKPVLTFFFGDLPGTVAVGTPLLQLMGFAAFFLALIHPINAIFQGMGETKLPVWFLLIGTSVKLIGNVILLSVPTIHILGAAISTLLCYFTVAFLSIFVLQKKICIQINWGQVLYKPMIAGIICGITGFCVNYTLTKCGNTSIITIVSVLFGAVAYLISLVLLRVGNGEVTFLSFAVQKIRLLLAKKKKIV